MKVLTLHQPWASLVALGVKTIETRSWSTQYRGPLAIHAGARKPRRVWTQDGPPVLYDPIAIERYLEIAEDGNNPGQFAYDWRGPLGAIVATCTLLDVVRIVGPKDEGDDWGDGWAVTDQLPYGDFTPGRYAWLLADVVAVDPPVPFKGGQGLTRTWTPEAVSA